MAEQPKARRRNTREELIKAGVEEINRYGVAGFSMRRIAQLCGVSCGAPKILSSFYLDIRLLLCVN